MTSILLTSSVRPRPSFDTWDKTVETATEHLLPFWKIMIAINFCTFKTRLRFALSSVWRSRRITTLTFWSDVSAVTSTNDQNGSVCSTAAGGWCVLARGRLCRNNDHPDTNQSQVHSRCGRLKVWGENTFLGEEDFCFYFMFNRKFSGHNKTWGALKKLGDTAPRSYELELRRASYLMRCRVHC